MAPVVPKWRPLDPVVAEILQEVSSGEVSSEFASVAMFWIVSRAEEAHVRPGSGMGVCQDLAAGAATHPRTDPLLPVLYLLHSSHLK